MKKFLLIFFGLIIVAAISVSVYVSLIDWNQHKDKIANQLLNITGKKVVFSGPVSMTVFPFPTLNATNVKVYSSVNFDVDNPLMTIDSVVADLSFSALLGGSFDVKMMSLLKPKITVRKNDEGINWIDNAQLGTEEEDNNVTIALDSVLLQDATMHVIDETIEREILLTDLNAEIIADSLRGPYRIDGSYTKNENPEGFAISIGSLSESFATNLNFVLSKPASESYLRFDGTFMLSNNAVNGNLIFESKKFKSFYDSMVTNRTLSSYWDKPLETSMELKVDKTQVEFANIIAKYGDTVGAGNITIPLREKSYDLEEDNSKEKLNVSAKFEMTNLNLEPCVLGMRDFINKQLQKDIIYNPDFPFNLTFDVSAIKAVYNNQDIKDFSLLLNLKDNVWELSKIGGVFPGTTSIDAKGSLFAIDDVMSYKMSVDVKSTVVKKFLEWINIPVKAVVNSTYQKSRLQAEIGGDENGIKISPFKLSLDTTTIEGQFGVKRGNPMHYALEATTDSVILDNYIPNVFVGSENKLEKLNELWTKLGVLNQYNIDVMLKAGLLIYDSSPLDNVVIDASLREGIVTVNNFSFDDFLSTKLKFSGEVKGLGDKVQFSDLNYSLNVDNFASWMKKTGYDLSDWNISYFQPFISEGTFSLNNDDLIITANNKTGQNEINYVGHVLFDKQYSLDGEVNFISPNVSELFKNIPLGYVPQDVGLGRMQLKGNINGNLNKFNISDMITNIGSSIFQGEIGLDKTTSIPNLMAKLKINRFEPEKYLSKKGNIPQFKLDGTTKEENSLWSKPILSDTNFDLSLLKSLSFSADLDIDELLYQNDLFKSVSVVLDNKNNELSITKFQSSFGDGKIVADLKYGYTDVPVLKGNVQITNQNTRDFGWYGSVYGVQSGIAEINVQVDTSAQSMRNILDNFTGTLMLSINKPVVKGLDFASIMRDLEQRKVSDGFQAVLMDGLSRSETTFNIFDGKINFQNGNWTIENAKLESSGALVNISGNGNLQAWNMDGVFVVQLLDPEGVNPFTFELEGAMSNPDLKVEASPITKVYDDQKAKEEAEEKAKKEAHDQSLRKRMDALEILLNEVKNEFGVMVDNEYSAIKNKISKNVFEDELSLLDGRIQKQKEEFEKADVIFGEKVYSDDMPAMLVKMIDDAKSELSGILADISLLYVKDMQTIIKGNYDEIEKVNNLKNQVLQDNVSKKEEYVLRLNNIITNYQFQNDEMHNQLLDAIDSRLKEYDVFTRNFKRYGNDSLEVTDIEILEQDVIDSKQMLENARTQQNLLNNDINRYLTYIDDKLDLEEKIYEDKKKAEADAKKIEENIGKISAPEKGKVQTIVRSIEEIEGDENSEDTDNEIENDTEDSQEYEIDLLRDITPPVKASGTISKK